MVNYVFQLQPSQVLQAPGHCYQLGLAYSCKTLAYLNEYTLGHCGLSAASRHKLAFTSRHYSLLTATWHDSTPVNSFVKQKVNLGLSSKFRTPHEGVRQATSHYWMPMPTGNWENPQVYGQWAAEDSKNWLFANRNVQGLLCVCVHLV